MYFCPNCSYLFDIAKTSVIADVNNSDNRKIISKIADAFKLLDKEEDMTNYKAIFSIDELNKNKRYQKLSENDKVKFNQLFQETISSGAELRCNNCNNSEPIKETILLYEYSTSEVINNIKTIEENQFICQDPLLPHTHDYSCKNPSCITHKKPELKDSVFMRHNNSFKLTYICCVCHFSW